MAEATDPGLKREMQLEAYRHDLSKTLKVEDIAKYYLDAGMEPSWIAHRFGLALERCQAYAQRIKEQREEKRTRRSSEG
jgi:hypothetical protein